MNRTRRYSCVYQHAGIFRPQIVTVTATTASETAKYEIHFCHFFTNAHKSACKDTTNIWNVQVFCQKNSLCLHKNGFLWQKTCRWHECANVFSEGTHPVGEGACRKYNKPIPASEITTFQSVCVRRYCFYFSKRLVLLIASQPE